MITSRTALFSIFVVCVLALGIAFTAEFGFHISPCLLCLAQRVPFALAVVVSIIALCVPKFRRAGFYTLTILFLVNAGIACYQIGVENHLWGVDAAGQGQICSANSSAQNIKDLYQSMSGTPVGDCAHPAFNFHGITFAVMNAILSLALMVIAARQLSHRFKFR